MKKEIKDFGNKLAMKALEAKYAIGGTMIAAMAGAPLTAHASGGNVGTSTSAGSLVNKLADIIVGIFPLIGVFFVISGAVKMFLAYRNDQPEAQAAAAKDIVIGAVFIAFRVFVWNQLSTVIKQ